MPKTNATSAPTENRGGIVGLRNFSSMMIEAHCRVCNAAAAERFWNTLTDGEKKSLGGDLPKVYAPKGTIGMWLELHNGSEDQAIIEIAHTIGAMPDADYYMMRREIAKNDSTLSQSRRNLQTPRNREEDPDERVTKARDSYDLVLVRGPGERRLYLKSELVDVDWGKNPKVWDFLAGLVEQAEHGHPAAWDQVGCKNSDTAKNRRYRLKKLAPQLDPYLKTAGDSGTYQLMVSPSRIKRIELGASETLLD